MPKPPPTSLRTNLSGLTLASPIVLAAGCAGTLHEMHRILDLSRIGAVTSKSITMKPREGTKPPRVIPAGKGAVGMLNAVGLANPGIDAFEADYMNKAADLKTNIFVSVAGFTLDEYAALAATVDPWQPVQAVELNVSCPNVKTGTSFGDSPRNIRETVAAVRKHVNNSKLIVKLSPNTADLPVVARAAIDAGADILNIANTFPAMQIDPITRKPSLSRGSGGLGGPALFHITLKLVHDVYTQTARQTGTPIIATGGVMHWKQAAQYILAGATAVSMGTALYADPRSPNAVLRGLDRWAREQGVGSVGELRGQIAAT